MTTKNDGGPAFPVLEATQDDTYQNIEIQHAGMTLRDYFAAKVLAGLNAHDLYASKDMGWLAKAAYDQADAMLLERAK